MMQGDDKAISSKKNGKKVEKEEGMLRKYHKDAVQ